jgi:hypothetical protein
MLSFVRSLRTMIARRSIASVHNLSNGKGVLVERMSATRVGELSGLQPDNKARTHWILQGEFSKRKLNSLCRVIVRIPSYYPTQVSLPRRPTVDLERTFVNCGLFRLKSVL